MARSSRSTSTRIPVPSRRSPPHMTRQTSSRVYPFSAGPRSPRGIPLCSSTGSKSAMMPSRGSGSSWRGPTAATYSPGPVWGSAPPALGLCPWASCRRKRCSRSTPRSSAGRRASPRARSPKFGNASRNASRFPTTCTASSSAPSANSCSRAASRMRSRCSRTPRASPTCAPRSRRCQSAGNRELRVRRGACVLRC